MGLRLVASLDGVTTSPPSVFIRPVTRAHWHVIWIEPRAEDRAVRDIRQQPDWGQICHADGVFDVLRNDGRPMRLPHGFVESLQHAEQLGLFDYTKAPAPFAICSQVQLDRTGPFAKMIGKVKRARSRDRIDVLLNYLNREMLVNVPIARLSAA